MNNTCIDILKRICQRAEKQADEKLGRYVGFENICLRYSPEFSWGLAIYDISNGNEMHWILTAGNKSKIDLGELFIQKARTYENEMILQAAIGDGSIKLPILGNDKFNLPDAALSLILHHMIKEGAVAIFKTFETLELKKQVEADRRKLHFEILKAERTFGKNAPQTNALRRVAMQKIMKMHSSIDNTYDIVNLAPECSCIEELEMRLDMEMD